VNRLLTSVINPISTQTFSVYQVNNCNLTGTLDLSGLTGLGGTFEAYSNPLLTNIINPITVQQFTYYSAYSCALNVIDWSNLNGNMLRIYLQDNGMTSAEADENIVGIDTDLTWTSTKILNIAGTNDVLTDGTVTGFNGIAAKDSLITKGVAVTFN
jgi:hypothetical protein